MINHADDAVIRTHQLRKVYAGAPAFGPPGARPGGPPGGRPAGPVASQVSGGVNGAPTKPRDAAVDSLDLEVGRGEIFGLLGPNGAGKSTTIGMLTTRIVPTSGTAMVAGIDVIAHPAATKQHIGVVTQTNTLDRALTVRENLVFHGRYFGMPNKQARAEADRLLEVFRLGDKSDVGVQTLSGGLAQRLMVARSIMHRPSVLFLDEPTAGLDPQTRLSLWELIRELNAGGQTVLLTTHYMEEADELCGRLAIMDHGRILALDTPDGLKRSVDADTVVTITAAGDAGGLATALASGDGVVKAEATPRGVEVHMRAAPGIVPRLMTSAADAGFEVTDVSVAEPSLETVFIQLTGKDLRD
ncbi:MAG: daunorubicin resistance transporter ATP-binding subunit [Acidimicrobiales bacterium]|nr:daunorubicin resistance transporter ATP-binding subunit [Acidimicrobiales bacterium]